MMSRYKIKWKNIYYMLTYAIEGLKYMEPDDIQLETCETLDDLLAELMYKSMELLNKNRHLNDYNRVRMIKEKPRGNIMIEESYRTGAYAKGKLCCNYFELNINCIQNRIIKSTIINLLEYGKISVDSKRKLIDILDDMLNIDNLGITEIDFDDIDYYQLPDWYKPAIIVSKLILEELLGKDDEGNNRLYMLDERKRLSYIMETFVRRFYQTEYKKCITTKAEYEASGRKNELDALLESKTRALIIDTKWYESRGYRENRTSNERQMLDYIISFREHEVKEGDERKTLTGVILYGRTDENQNVLTEVRTRSLGEDYGDCKIYEKTLDLDQEFDEIKQDLVDLADEFLLDV